MDAIITAGGIPGPRDPLYPETLGKPKALLDVAGKPMIQWILDAVSGSSGISRVFVAGLDAGHALVCSKPIEYLPDQGSLLENIRSGAKAILERDGETRYGLFISSDIPAITSATIDWIVSNMPEGEWDLIYNVIERSVMERQFPGSGRSYIRLRDMEVCAGDIHVINLQEANGRDSQWNRIRDARKNPVKMGMMIGLLPLWLVLSGRGTLEHLTTVVSARLGLKGYSRLCPFPETGMDIDKPFQLEILRAYLSNR